MTHAILESPEKCPECRCCSTDTGPCTHSTRLVDDHAAAQNAAIAQAVRAAAGSENPVAWVLEGSSGYLSVANSKISAISNAIAAELRKLGNASPTT